MTWFFIAIVAPFLYAITNHIDKILLEKYFKEGGVGTLILFSSLLSVIAVPFIYLSDPTILDVELFNIFILALVGIFNLAVLWFYFLALQDDEPSVVIVFYQLVPVVGLILGYYILNETLSPIQLTSMAIIIIGTALVSFDFDENDKVRLRKKTILCMLAASILWATETTIFKMVALEENVVRSLFWEHVVLVIVGVLIFIFISSYRRHFLRALKVNSKAIISLNFLNEGLFMTGNIVVAFALILAPVALILLMESFQPIFVLFIAVILALFFPKLATEKVDKRHMWQKIFAIVVTGFGTYLLLFFG